MGKKVVDIDKLKYIVAKSYSIASVCRGLNIRPSGCNYKTLNRIIKDNNLNTSHFTGQSWSRGLVGLKSSIKIPLNDILSGKATYTNSNSLRKRLIQEGIKKSECEICLLAIWNGKPIPLELDHIDGNNTNNILSNLRIICPNCHAQTPTYRAKNKLSALSEKRDVEYRKFGETLTGNPEPSLNKEGVETRHGKPKSIIYCKVCSTKTHNKTYCGLECYNKDRHKTVPKVPEILQAFKLYKSFLQVGKHFGVTDNTVRKWCESYGIMEMVKV